jgi:hypothetical protein
MMKSNSGVTNRAIDRILELSAAAQIQRRWTVRDSEKFHNLTGAIAAYGKALGILAALQYLEEFHALIHQHDVPKLCGHNRAVSLPPISYPFNEQAGNEQT